MSKKYVLTVTGEVKVKDNNSETNWNISDIRLPNKLNKEDVTDRQSNKFSEFSAGGGLLFSQYTFSPSTSIEDNPTNNVINQSNKLLSNSFGFDEEQREPVTFYNSYNTVFDLDLENFDNSNSTQIFAKNLDFFGFPQFSTDPLSSLNEIVYVTTTLIDMAIFALIPITTITSIQFLIQNSKNDKNATGELNELGKYISYKDKNFAINILIETLTNILNSFERAMNFPKFQFKFDQGANILQRFLILGKEILKRILYFFLGYMSYLVPGLKIESVLLNANNILTSLLDILTILITTTSSRHNFNLLVRKITRNNYFRNTYLKGEARTSSPDSGFASSFSYFSSFIFRFIGERIAVGEKIWSIDTSREKNYLERFNSTRDVSGKLIIREDIIITEEINPNLSSSTEKDNKTRNSAPLDINDDYIQNYKDQKRTLIKDLNKKENKIDEDYMPFTFQDLRDNSIINFHAYIDSISDSYNANYNEIGGYGRVDKIKNLIATTRSINLTFNIVATGEEDFYKVWQKINRLVDMVYPQWTKGTEIREYSMGLIKKDFMKYNTQQKEVSNNDYVNIVNNLHVLKIPYSEMPSNSPMIRLRVGNLICSNRDSADDNEINKYIKNNLDDNGAGTVNNPFLFSQYTMSGKGLAGYITNLGIDWDQQTPWEIRPYIGSDNKKLGQRPFFSKISIGFAPIHDIPLGIKINKANDGKKELSTNTSAYYLKK